MMKLLVCGGRYYNDRDRLYRILDGVLERNAPVFLIVGYNPKDPTYQGADQLAFEWARDRRVGFTNFPADWMAYKPSHAIAFGGIDPSVVDQLAEVGIKAHEVPTT